MKRKRKKSKIWWGKESIFDDWLAAVIVSEGYIAFVELIWGVEDVGVGEGVEDVGVSFDVGVGLYVGGGVGGGVGTWPSNLRKGWNINIIKELFYLVSNRVHKIHQARL